MKIRTALRARQVTGTFRVKLQTGTFWSKLFRQSSNELRSKNHNKSLAHSNDAILMNSLLYYVGTFLICGFYSQFLSEEQCKRLFGLRNFLMYANIRNENVAMAIKVL